jgi:hypothetical protein
MALRSAAGSSRTVQAGKTIVRFHKPIADGTRTSSDVAILIGDPDAKAMALIVFPTEAAKLPVLSGEHRLRNACILQMPTDKRSNPAQAPAAHNAKVK